MEGLNLYNILSYGAIGLGCILAVLAYFLLTKEQEQAKPRKQILTSIYIFMGFSLILGLTGFVTEHLRGQSSSDSALFVTLIPPENVPPNGLALVSGQYEYVEPTTSGELTPHRGEVVVALREGGWQAALPEQVINRAVKLMLKDQQGNQWNVHPFYPNYTKQHLFKDPSPSQASTSSPLLELASLAKAHAAEGELSRSVEGSRNDNVYFTAQSIATIRFNNYARHIGELYGRTYYQWRVFVDEPMAVLDRIEEVQYLLHPTFPEPFVIRKYPGDGFALETSGWGEFTIVITVKFKDGIAVRTSYRLNLSKGWP